MRRLFDTLKSFTFLDWVFLFGQISGSLLVAANIGLNVLGYTCYLVSSIAGIALMWGTTVAPSILVITMYFAVVNTIGIIRYA